MRNQPFILYFRSNDIRDAERIDITADNCGVAIERINVDNNPDAAEEIKLLTDSKKPDFPVLRVGRERIVAVLFNPPDGVIKTITDDDSPTVPMGHPIIYTTTWCGTCRMIKEWLDDNNIKYKEINIEDKEDIAEKIIQWTNGRRVVPTIEFKGIGRFFNPGLDMLKRLV